MSVIIANDRDQLAFNYLKKVVGESRINDAVNKLAGARKPYISSIAKILNVTIPTDLQSDTLNEKQKDGLLKAREQLARLKQTTKMK